MRGVLFCRRMHGKGRFTFENGEMFVGTFDNNQMHGAGTHYTSGLIYEGNHVHGERLGRGRVRYAGGDTYTGQIGYTFVEDERRVAQGRPPKGQHAYFPQNEIGQPLKWGGIPHGTDRENVYTFADGSTYTGSLKDGRVNGRGKYKSVTGEVMEGMFRDGVLHGKGRHVDVNGVTKEGIFRHGSLFGHGKETIPAKRSKSVLNKKGEISLAYPSEVYEGEFVNGERQGRGCVTYGNGDFFDGLFDGGVRQGPGTFLYGNVRFEGEVGTELRRYDHKYEGEPVAVPRNT